MYKEAFNQEFFRNNRYAMRSIISISLILFMMAFAIPADAAYDCPTVDTIEVIITQGEKTTPPFNPLGTITFNTSFPVKNPKHNYIQIEFIPDVRHIDQSIKSKQIEISEMNARSIDGELYTYYEYEMYPSNIQKFVNSYPKSEFANWILEHNSIWGYSWYNVTVDARFCNNPDAVSLEGAGPDLHIPFCEFRNPLVSPRMGTGNQLYTYSLDVYAGEADNITLKISDSKGGPWIDQGTREYTTPWEWQPLTWPNVTLDFELTDAGYYKFEGCNNTGPICGPELPVNYTYSNSSVTPLGGFQDEPFTYTLDVNSTVDLDVWLWVKDMNSGRNERISKRTYSNRGHLKPLKWRGIRTGDYLGSDSRPCYYFSFHRTVRENVLEYSHERDGYYSGPEIVLVKFDNGTVTPKVGSNNTQYSYCVNIDTSLPECDIELKTKAPGEASSWIRNGERAYDGSTRRLCWDNVTLESYCPGNSSYKFVSEGTESEEHSGPYTYFGNCKEPKLITIEYEDVLYLGNDGTADQSIKAIVNNVELGSMVKLVVKGLNKHFENVSSGVEMSNGTYVYEWNVPFNLRSAGVTL